MRLKNRQKKRENCQSPVTYDGGYSRHTYFVRRFVGILRAIQEEKQLPKLFQSKCLLISPEKWL